MSMEKIGYAAAKVMSRPEVSEKVAEVGVAALVTAADVVVPVAIAAAPVVVAGAAIYGIGKWLFGD